MTDVAQMETPPVDAPIQASVRYSFVIPSTAAAVRSAVKMVRTTMEWMDFDKDWLFRTELALHEALLNAHHHGNSGNKEREIRVICSLAHDIVEMDIEDEGTGYLMRHPLVVLDPPAPHGRGLYLIRQLMKSVRILEGGKRIIMSLSKE